MIEQLKQLMKILILVIILVVIINIVGLFGVFDGGDGCYFRYNLDPDSNNKYHINDTKASEAVLVNANGYYDATTDPRSPSSYGKWKKTNIFLTKESNVIVNIEGDVSLCKSYVSHDAD